MSSIAFNNEYDLGVWGTFRTDFLPVSLKLLEKTELSFHPVNPWSGEINAEQKLNCAIDSKIYDYILKTKSDPSLSLFPLFISPRTHTFKDGVLDFFIPMTRRFTDNLKEPSLSDIVLTINVFIADIFTILIRIFTIIPRAIYNSQKEPHPAKVYFPPNTESVFVECKKTWQINENKEEGFKGEAFTAVFRWRVDFYSPLQSTFEWQGKKYALDANFSEKRVVLEDNLSDRLNFRNRTTILGLAPNDFLKKDEVSSRPFLYQKLESLCVEPQVTFI